MPRGPKGGREAPRRRDRRRARGAHDGQRRKEIAKKAAKTRWVM
jgi:hypothetical protein